MKKIPLTRGAVALVDDADFEALAAHGWYCTSHGYAQRSTSRNGKRVHFYMHRVIAGAAEGQPVDHINGETLDNRRSNLRVCTVSQNLANAKPIRARLGRRTSSMFKGVFFERQTRRWRAMIHVHGRGIGLGRFDDEIEAAKAYDNAAVDHFGEFARLNFPEAA